VISWDAEKPAKIRIVKVASLPSIVAATLFRISNKALQRIEILNFVRSVLVAPITIGILTIEMIIFAFIDNEGDLTFTRRTLRLIRSFIYARDILHHKINYILTGTSFSDV
jgi:hypothetical protein